MRWFWTLSAVVFVSLMLGAFNCANALQYSFTNLGVYSANGINDSGQIVVLMGDDFDTLRSGLWDNGVITDLGTLGGTKTIALSINNSGEIIGWSETDQGESHAFLWKEGVMYDLGGGNYSCAVDINDSGQIVGYSGDRATMWENGAMNVVKEPKSSAVAINNIGQITGRVASDHTEAVLWEDGNLTELGTLGGESSWASDINNSGQIVGSSHTTSNGTHGFIWDAENGMQDLGFIGGPSAINDLGEVVGRMKIDSIEGDRDAFYWSPETGLIDLDNLLGVNFYQANDINELGQIVGFGFVGESWKSERFGFLLTPIAEPVPEPSTMLLLCCGIVGFMSFRKRFERS